MGLIDDIVQRTPLVKTLAIFEEQLGAMFL
jgi:hypothetical protein